MTKGTYQNNIVFSYQGTVDIAVLTFFGKYIKLLLSSDPGLSTKVYKIFIELAQNISYYSAEVKTDDPHNGKGVGKFKLLEYPEKYTLVAENLVHKTDGLKLNDKCSEINELSFEELRMLKRVKRRELVQIDTGAHIGLIHVGLLAESKIEYEVKDIDTNYSFFSISIDIEKNIKN
jgi:hypothetical protein